MRARVLLALEPDMFREILADTLEREEDIELVGEVDDPVDLLLAVEETQADVVLHSFPESGDLPAICTHLFAEHPDLRIIGLSPDGELAYACQQKITVRPLAHAGIEDLLCEIREAAHD